MGEFHQHPSGVVIVRGGGGLVYLDTPENFEADAGVPAPEIPEGSIDRLYVAGVRHPYSDGANVIGGGPLVWQFADELIARVDELLAAKAAREAAAQPEPQVPDPGTVPPRLKAAAFEVTVENFDITAMNGVFNLVSAAYLDVGQYMLFFLSPMEDTAYWVEFGGGAPYMTVQLKDPTCVIIQAQDAVGGAFVDPASFSVKIYRID